MEDNNNEGMNFEDMLGALGVNKSKPIASATVHPAFASCDEIYECTHDVHGLPIYLGVNATSNCITVGFGKGQPFQMDREQAMYMMVGLSSLISKAIKEHFGKQPADIHADTKKVLTQITFNKGKGVQESTNIKNIIEDDTVEDEQIDKNLEEIKGNLDEIKNMIEQAEEYTKNMSPEDKAEYAKALSKKHEELLAKKAREFERSLLGSLEEEESITYDYNYFKDIHEKQGAAALKEELAKLPPEERQEIITKIVEQAKLKKTQKPVNNDENTDQEDH